MKIFYYDLETTGINSEIHGIVQLAYIVEIDGVVKEEGQFFCNPIPLGKKIEDAALEINHLTLEQIKTFDKPEIFKKKVEDVLGKYVSKFDKEDKYVIAGYNVDFDIRFLKKLWSDLNDKFFHSWFDHILIDPYQMMKFFELCGIEELKNTENKKLETIARTFECVDLFDNNFHDAMTDIRVTRKIVLYFKDKLSPSTKTIKKSLKK